MHVSRPHGLTVFFLLTKYFWVLLLPAARAVLAYGFDIENAFRGYGTDIFLSAVLLANALSRWLCCTLTVDSDGISVRKGLVIKKSCTVSFNSACCIKLESNPFLSVFRCYRLSAYTDSGKAPAVKLYCRQSAAGYIKTQILCRMSGKRVRFGSGGAVFSALISAGSRNGLLFLSAALSYIGIAVGKSAARLAQENIGQLYNAARGTAGVVFIGGAVAFAGWAVSFVINLLSALRYSVIFSYDRNAAVIEKGTAKKSFCIVRGADWRIYAHSLFFPLYSAVFIGRRGFGSGRYEENILLPSVKPGKWNLDKAQLYPSVNTAVRFALVPTLVFAAVCFICGAGYGCGIVGDVFALVLPLPFFLRIIYAMYDYVCTAALIDGERLWVSFSGRSRRLAAEFSKDSCGAVVLRQNPFQRKKATADIDFKVKGTGRLKIRLKHIDVAECAEFIRKIR